MNLVRKIKISKLTNIPLTGVDKEIVDFINSKLSNLIPFNYYEIPSSLFYMSPEGKWILQLVRTDFKMLWIRYADFLEVLELKYLMTHENILFLLCYMLEQTLGQKLPSIVSLGNGEYYELEGLFKQQYELS